MKNWMVRATLVAMLASNAPFTAKAQKLLPDAMSDLATDIAKRVEKQKKTRIAVVPFRELGGQPTVFGTYLSEELVTNLVNAGSLDLVERATLDRVMGELKLNESGAIDPATAKKVGMLVGADAIVTGTVTDFQSFVAVNCRLVDTQTGRIFAAAEARIVKDDDVKKVMNEPLEKSTQGGGKAAPPSVERATNSVRESQIFTAQVSAEQNGLLVGIRDCTLSGTTLSCSGFANNKADDRRQVNLAFTAPSAIDNLGNPTTGRVAYMSARRSAGSEGGADTRYGYRKRPYNT
jgi:TolB-like protein